MFKSIITFLFGERVQGEPVSTPTVKTTFPAERPSEYEWYKMFRVSSLHNVNQHVFLGAE